MSQGHRTPPEPLILPDNAVRYGDDLTDEGVDLVHRLKRLHEEALMYARSVRERVVGGKHSTGLAPDVAWCLRELQRYGDDVRKEALKADELAAKVACALWLQQALADPASASPKLEGTIAVASVKSGQAANPPERGTPEWAALMDYLRVPPEARELVSVRWTSLSELLTKRAADGLPPPPGIPAERTYLRYGLQNVRLKRGVDITK